MHGTTVLQGGEPLFYTEWRVMRMNKRQFNFHDLLEFGLFMLALRTFIYMICQ